MTDEKDKLVTQDANAIGKKIKLGSSSALHQRVAAAQVKKQVQEVAVAQLPNRIGMMLDDSGSMAGDKAAKARIASKAFIGACDASTTAIAIRTFDPTFQVSLTNQLGFVAMESQQLSGVGGTGLSEAMNDMLNNEPITQAVIVSDGEANDPQSAIETAHTYKEAGIVVDCVHIGNSQGGEETLRSIAKITGGIYIKFTDVTNFAQNFKYLTPQYKALLPASNAERARLLGASEVS